MVSDSIIAEFENAIENPEEYGSGEARNKLRAAFDLMSSQVCRSILGNEPLSRMNARQMLNGCKQEDFPADQWNVIARLREAIRASETTIHAKDYSDHTDDISFFISKHLKGLYEVLV